MRYSDHTVRERASQRVQRAAIELHYKLCVTVHVYIVSYSFRQVSSTLYKNCTLLVFKILTKFQNTGIEIS